MTPARPPFARSRPKRFSHDFETFSEANLKVVGASAYSRHPTTEVLMLAYAFDSGPVRQWVPEEGEEMPAEIEDALLDDRIVKSAWNKPFEWSIWANTLGLTTPHRAWRDPMVLALTCSLPASLDRAGRVTRLADEFAKTKGTRLINLFSVPQKGRRGAPPFRVRWRDKPDLWEEFKAYNRQDVEAERKIALNLSPYDLPPHEWELWALDQEINQRGIPINVGMARNAARIRDHVVAVRLEKLRKVTGLANPNSTQQLLPWLQDRGYVFSDLKKGHVARALDRDGSDELKTVLRLRAEVSRTAPKKFDALLKRTDADGRLRDAHQFAGAARTWRWAGRGFQTQNLASPAFGMNSLEFHETPSGHKRVCGGAQIEVARAIEFMEPESLDLIYDPMKALSGAVRTVVQAPEGQIFLDADLAAIENVVLGFISGDRKILSVFAENRDPYIDFATYLYNQPYAALMAQYKGGDGSRRKVAKPGVLGCGYMLGAGAQYEDPTTGEIEATGLLGYAWNMGVKLTPEQSALSVKVWRDTYRDAVQFWWDIDKAAKRCVRTKKPTQVRHIRFDRSGPFLRMILPSDRALHYLRPRVEDWLAPWGDYKETLTYEQENEKGQWERVGTHPGKLTENADQAIARDLLAHGMTLAARRGVDIVMHVHDQIVGLCDEDEADKKLAILVDSMQTRPKWAQDIPIRAAAHMSKWFVKD